MDEAGRESLMEMDAGRSDENGTVTWRIKYAVGAYVVDTEGRDTAIRYFIELMKWLLGEEPEGRRHKARDISKGKGSQRGALPEVLMLLDDESRAMRASARKMTLALAEHHREVVTQGLRRLTPEDLVAWIGCGWSVPQKYRGRKLAEIEDFEGAGGEEFVALLIDQAFSRMRQMVRQELERSRN